MMGQTEVPASQDNQQAPFFCPDSLQEVSEPTKEEKAVAKYLRFNCPTKSTNMMGHRVDYFVGECPAGGPPGVR